jgi:hypothetical protein
MRYDWIIWLVLLVGPSLSCLLPRAEPTLRAREGSAPSVSVRKRRASGILICVRNCLIFSVFMWRAFTCD